MAVRPEDFKDALKDYPSGVTVVTSADSQGNPLGATVSAFTSLSLEPPLVLVCLNRSSRTSAAIASRRAYAIHILDASQATLARRFALDNSEKFEQAAFTINDAGVPCLDDCHLRLECTLQDEYSGGDHVILVGLVDAAYRGEDIEPLVFARRGFYALGPRLVEA